jgi:DNA repair ATPase RecN
VTTGEKLVELSDLSTGTALEHLLAITTGGAGTGDTVIIDGIRAVVSDQVSAAVVGDLAAELEADLEAVTSPADSTVKLDPDLEGEFH